MQQAQPLSSDITPLSPVALDPPGPAGSLLLGNIPQLKVSGDILRFVCEQWRIHGDVFRIKLGPMNSTIFIQPEHIRQIALEHKETLIKGRVMDSLRFVLGDGLVTTDGDLWRRQRKLMQPFFTPKGIQRFGDDMLQATTSLLETWERDKLDGRPFDVGVDMTSLALSIITRTMFGMDLGGRSQETNAAFTRLLEFIAVYGQSPVRLPFWLPTARHRQAKRDVAVIDAIIYEIIDKHRAMPAEESTGLIGKLLHAKDEETGEVMSLKQLRDEVITIYFAGHDTTARTLTWLWYFLSRHPDVRERMEEEVDRVLGGRIPTVEDTRALTYTKQVVDEVLRHYGPVYTIARDVTQDTVIGGYQIPAGQFVMPFNYATHRHPDHWKNPEGFDPDHFSPEQVKARDKLAYFPFGIGERVCIGNNFSLLESVLIAATITQRYRLDLIPGTFITPKVETLLHPSAPVMVTLHRR